MKARLIIADDHEVVRQGLREIAGMAGDLQVVAEAADGAAAEQLARDRPAELLILDIGLPVRRGITILESLRADGIRLPVLFFSMYPAAQYSEFAHRVGAQGFVGKDANTETLLLAIRRILAGEPSFPPRSRAGASSDRIDDPFLTLSARETEVMLGLLQGESLQSIAQRLNIGAKSVTTYRSRLLDKLRLANNIELAALANRYGYL